MSSNTVTLDKHKFSFRLTKFRWLLILLTLAGLVTVLWRMIVGLGPATNLTDSWAWGVWIWADLTFIAWAGCGFSIAVLSHVLRIKEYRQLSRMALLTSFALYIAALAILLFELGRWDNFYTPIYSFAVSSPLYEVFMCITAYFLLQMVEMVEVWGDGYSAKVKKVLHPVMTVVLIVACILPFGHQASLGGMYLGMPNKLNALWSCSFLPWASLINSFFGGLAVCLVVYFIVNKVYNRATDENVATKLTKLFSVIALAYVVVKLLDVIIRGQAGLMTQGLTGVSFCVELFVLTLLPALLGLVKGNCHKAQLASALMLGVGVALNRFNIIFIGMKDYLGGGYFPSFAEILITIGMFCLSLLVFLVIAENLPVFHSAEKNKYVAAEE